MIFENNNNCILYTDMNKSIIFCEKTDDSEILRNILKRAYKQT